MYTVFSTPRQHHGAAGLRPPGHGGPRPPPGLPGEEDVRGPPRLPHQDTGDYVFSIQYHSFQNYYLAMDAFRTC